MNWDEYFMRHVYLVASKSKDPRTRIGAVLVKDQVVISEGYNGIARKVRDLPERYNNREVKYDFIVHSEHNAVLNCARRGVSTLDSILYSQGVPCHKCADPIIQAGIKEIVVHKQWPNLVYSEMWVASFKIASTKFEEAGVLVRYFDGELGVEGFLDGKILKV